MMSTDEDLPEAVRRDARPISDHVNRTGNEINHKNDTVTTLHGVVILDTIYIDKMPKLYAKSLLEFSAYVNKFLQTEENISSDTVKFLEGSINTLAESLMYVDPIKGPTYFEKKLISADLAMVAGALLSMSPKIAEQIASSSLFIQFDELTSEPFRKMVEEIKRERI